MDLEHCVAEVDEFMFDQAHVDENRGLVDFCKRQQPYHLVFKMDTDWSSFSF